MLRKFVLIFVFAGYISANTQIVEVKVEGIERLFNQQLIEVLPRQWEELMEDLLNQKF